MATSQSGDGGHSSVEVSSSQVRQVDSQEYSSQVGAQACEDRKPGHTASNAEKSTKGAAGGDLPWGERWEARHGGAFL